MRKTIPRSHLTLWLGHGMWFGLCSTKLNGISSKNTQKLLRIKCRLPVAFFCFGGTVNGKARGRLRGTSTCFPATCNVSWFWFPDVVSFVLVVFRVFILFSASKNLVFRYFEKPTFQMIDKVSPISSFCYSLSLLSS